MTVANRYRGYTPYRRRSSKKLTKREAEAIAMLIIMTCNFFVTSVKCMYILIANYFKKFKVNKKVSNLNLSNLDFENNIKINESHECKLFVGDSIEKHQSHVSKVSSTIVEIDNTLYTEKTHKTVIDNSIIDVTNQLEKLPEIQILPLSMDQEEVFQTNTMVPKWEHRYIYSYNDLSYANKEQMEFYAKFKMDFLNHKFIDVGNNFNYVFILLFDLLELEYKEIKNLKILEDNIFRLIDYYPITKSYALKNLIKKIQENSSNESMQGLKDRLGDDYYKWDGASCNTRIKLGDKFKNKVDFTDLEIKILNKNLESSNTFLRIEFCYITVIKFYLSVIEQMNESFKNNGTNLETEFKLIADIQYHKEKEHYWSYERSVESVVDYLYTYVMHFCETTVRDNYGYNRKLQNHFLFPNVKENMSERIEPAIHAAIHARINNIINPDMATEILLNSQCPTRWKKAFNKISSSISKDQINNYYSKVLELIQLNSSNEQLILNLCFEAFKTAVKYDKETSIKLYFVYLHSADKSNFKKIPKTIQKALFANINQLSKFEEILKQFLNDLDLEKALTAIPDIYAIKRKTITLDESLVKEIHKQHSSTVELLEEYLKDEELEAIIENSIKIVADKTTNNVPQPSANVISNGTNLNSIQLELIKLFVNNDCILPTNTLDEFATNNNTFKNALIESINEVCYNLLDDIFIEQLEDSYLISHDYYKRIFEK